VPRAWQFPQLRDVCCNASRLPKSKCREWKLAKREYAATTYFVTDEPQPSINFAVPTRANADVVDLNARPQAGERRPHDSGANRNWLLRPRGAKRPKLPA